MKFYLKKFKLQNDKLVQDEQGKLLGLLIEREIAVNGVNVANGVEEVYLFEKFTCNFTNKTAESFLKRFIRIHPQANFIETTLTIDDVPKIGEESIFRMNGIMIISNDYGIRLSDLSSTPFLGHYQRVLDADGNETEQFVLDENGYEIIKDGYIGMYDYYFEQVINPIIYTSWSTEIAKRVSLTGSQIIE